MLQTSTILSATLALLLPTALLCGCDDASKYVSIVEDNPPTDGFDFPVAPGEMDGWVEPPPPGETFDPSSYLVHREDGIHAAGDFFKANNESAAGHELWAIGDGVVVDIVFDREAYPDRHDGEDRDAEWGNLILIQHDYVEDGANKRVWSQYAHCQTIEVELGDVVARDQRIGSVGKTDGVEGQELWDVEHLHFETRPTNFRADAYPKDMGLTTDAQVAEHYVHPLEFIRAHRPAR